MRSTADFSIKTWLTVILLSPAILAIVYDEGLLSMYLYAIAYGILFALPALFFWLSAVYYVNKLKIREIFKKILLATAGCVVIYFTFYFLGFGGFFKDFRYVYGATLIVAIFIFKLKPPVSSKTDDLFKN